MIDTRKIFSNVAFQDVRVDLSKFLKAVDCGMGSLVFARRIGIVNEGWIKDWFHNIVK